MSRYVEIRYTDCIERVPLRDVSELRGILEQRGTYVGYSIHSHWWYGLVSHGKSKEIYDPAPSPQRRGTL